MVYSSSTKYVPEYYVRMLIFKLISQRRVLSEVERFNSEQDLRMGFCVPTNTPTGSINLIHFMTR